MSWTSGNGADQKLPTHLIKTGTANSWVMQSWEFAKSLNAHSALVPLHLGAKNLDRALGVSQEIRQPCAWGAVCEEKSVSGALRLPQEYVGGQQGKKALSQKLRQLGGSGERYAM